MSLVTVSNGHATMTSPAKTEGGDVLSEAVQEITKSENKPALSMVSAETEQNNISTPKHVSS